MSKSLVIAEKPSVANDLVKALTPQTGKFAKQKDYYENDTYVITSAVGHLLEIQAPEKFEVKRGKWSFNHLPVIPSYFALQPISKTETRLKTLVKLIKRKDVITLINACDAGREGELIFRLIIQYAKTKLPIKRLWLQSMTPSAIREGFAHLWSNERLQGLADAARSRAEADWLIGINGTRAMTAFNSQGGGFFLTTVGRVQTPTLSIVVEREEKIRQFKPRDYYEIHATFLVASGSYTGKWFDPQWKKDTQDPEKKADRLFDIATAQSIAQEVSGKTAQVRESSKPLLQNSPLLFDLTSLQREANTKFGFSAKNTLAIAQALYEKHKVLTYPRTDARALPEDYLPTTTKVFTSLANSHLKHLAVFAQQAIDEKYIKPTKRIFNDEKISDHFAIIPTLEIPAQLNEGEQKIYDMVVKRFLSVFYPPAEFLVTTRISEVETQTKPYLFKTEGKILQKAGWLQIYGKESQTTEIKSQNKNIPTNSNILVPLTPGETALVEKAQVQELRTRPPNRYTEATLLSAMEGAGKLIADDELRHAMKTKGLGTPATRASIIEGLLNEKYLVREGNTLTPLAKAFHLMTLLYGIGIDDLCKPELTGVWEYKLSQIEQGKQSKDDFMREITVLTKHMVERAKTHDRDNVPGNYITLKTPCPQCSGVVKENYRRYACIGKPKEEQKACGFSFSKTPGGRAFEPAEVEQLLQDRKTALLQGFRSKAGWPFAAILTLGLDNETKTWKLAFDFGNKENRSTLQEVDSTLKQQEPLGQCPECHASVFEYGMQYLCKQAIATEETPEPACHFKVGKVILQQKINPEQIQKLLREGKTDLLNQFVSTRTRRPFKAYLEWNKEKKKIVFLFEPRSPTMNKRKKPSINT
jgi:DNA topoisomerase-3